MTEEVLTLRSLEMFSHLFKDLTPLSVTAATVGKNHYMLLGSAHGYHYLWEKLPAPLLSVGKLLDGVDVLQIGVHHVTDDEGNSGCQLVTGSVPDILPAVHEAAPDKHAAASKKAKEFLTESFKGKVVPLDPVDDLKPLEGQDGNADVVIDMSDEVTYTCGEVTHILGSGTKFCRFTMAASDLRLNRRKGVTKMMVVPAAFPVVTLYCENEFGLIVKAKDFEDLKPQDVKSALEDLKQSLADFEECHKDTSVRLKGAIASQEACLRDFKKIFNDGVRIVAKLSSESGDPKKVEKLETELEKTKEDLKTAKDKASGLQKELKAYEKLEKALGAVAAAKGE